MDRYRATQQPVFAATLVRETHASDPLPPGGLKVQVSLSYSDGFGREIQKKIQAEPGSVLEGGPVVSPRWVGSGWTIFNNKGKPIKQYEPFFTDTHRFEFDVRIGVSSTLFYDPVERVVVMLHPNHTWEKVVFDPWQQTTYDVNDTVMRNPRTDDDVKGFFTRLPDTEYLPTWHEARKNGQLGQHEQAAAEKAAVHADTPTVAHADSLGRTFLTLAHNRFERSGAVVEEKYSTRVELDIEGNQREVIDARDRIVMRYDYDILSNAIRQASMEAGERWMLNDVAGNPLYAWDSRDHQFRTAYDRLRRPTDSFLREGAGVELHVGRTVYGETRPNPEARNLRGKVVQLFDQAGVITSDDYDFKGNLLSSQRQLAEEYKTTLNWSVSVPLEARTYRNRTTYDALNRPITLTTPDNSVIHPTFSEANLLEKVDVNLRGAVVATAFVTDIDYDAKGQRGLIDYGNGVRTTYEYDSLTFRLARLKTLRGAEQLQDLVYTYDPVGNITSIGDNAQQTIYFNGQVVEPHCDYVYDAIYRLIEAKGREHIGQLGRPETTWNDQFRVNLQHPHDGQAMRNYTERYEYDAVGNFEQLIHQAANGNWTRAYTHRESSLIEPGKKNNRLSSTVVHANGSQPIVEPYTHDAHGNMTSLPHLLKMEWDFKDQLRATSKQVNNSGPPETTYYVYDVSGQRVRKVTEHQAAAGQTPTLLKERIYLGGFEIYREYENDSDTVKLERETLHIMDDQQRVVLVETRTLDTAGNNPAPQQLIRYQFGNHLGSASLELDGAGQIISYEEYYPYGSTSYQAGRSAAEVSLKRYRYTGMERDEESGLNYHGARYFAHWLARWVSVDPLLAESSHMTPYCYSGANPIHYVDLTGCAPEITWSQNELLRLIEQWRLGVTAYLSRPDVRNLHRFVVEELAAAPGRERDLLSQRIRFINEERNDLIRAGERLKGALTKSGLPVGSIHRANDWNLVYGKKIAEGMELLRPPRPGGGGPPPPGGGGGGGGGGHGGGGGPSGGGKGNGEGDKGGKTGGGLGTKVVATVATALVVFGPGSAKEKAQTLTVGYGIGKGTQFLAARAQLVAIMGATAAFVITLPNDQGAAYQEKQARLEAQQAVLEEINGRAVAIYYRELAKGYAPEWNFVYDMAVHEKYVELGLDKVAEARQKQLRAQDPNVCTKAPPRPDLNSPVRVLSDNAPRLNAR